MKFPGGLRLKTRIVSNLHMLEGLTIISEPLTAFGDCGLNPEIMVPGASKLQKQSHQIRSVEHVMNYRTEPACQTDAAS